MTTTLSPPPPSVRSEARLPLWRHAAFAWPLVGAAVLAAASPLWWSPVAELLTGLELSFARLLPAETLAGTAWFLLPLAGFGGGLLASLSPCILPLVPLNVAAMLGFALGYTALVFVAGVFGGGLVARARQRSYAAPRAAAAALLLVAGVGFSASGIAWF